MHDFMKKTFLFLSLLIVPLLALDEISFENNVSDSNATDQNKSWVDGRRMLWEVPGLHGGKVYLFGSIHVGKPELYPLDENITQAFNESNYLVLETKMDEESKMAMDTAMYKDSKLTQGQTLKDLISKKNYERLEIKLKSLKMPPGSLDLFRPWVASLLIANTEIIRLGYSSEFGMDYYFETKAEREQKRTFTLESASEQIGLFANESDSFGEQFLELTLDTSPQYDKEIETLFEKWKEGNTSYFEEKIIAPMQAIPEINEKLLLNRNANMVQKVNIYRSSKKGSRYFVVLGLAHLLGETGIVQQLRDQNITVLRH